MQTSSLIRKCKELLSRVKVSNRYSKEESSASLVNVESETST